jgi:hypothetical protein
MLLLKYWEFERFLVLVYCDPLACLQRVADDATIHAGA